MNVKRLFTLIIGIAFIIAAIISCLFIFSIKSINTEYTISKNVNEQEIQDALDKYNGKNLLFFDEEEIRTTLSSFTNVKVISIEKSYPNVINVKLVEREIVYTLFQDSEYYLLDKECFIVKKTQDTTLIPQNAVSIKLEGEINYENLAVGSVLSTTDNDLFYSTINISNELSLSDCVTEIIVARHSKLVKDAVYLTRSGVSIKIAKPEERGVDKASLGFEKYHELENDFLKTYETIVVTLQDNGEIKVTWSELE